MSLRTVGRNAGRAERFQGGLTFRLRSHGQRECAAGRGDLATGTGVGMAPGQHVGQVGEVGSNGNEVSPRLETIVVPLTEAMRRRHLDHTAAVQQADEKIAERTGMAVDVDGIPTPAPR